jgi:hypothetical protein
LGPAFIIRAHFSAIPPSGSRISDRITNFPKIQLILHPNSCIIDPGAATPG